MDFSQKYEKNGYFWGKNDMNQEQYEILEQGVKVWNEWREGNPDIKIDLSNANLVHTNLCEVNFQNANLYSVFLIHSNLNKADLSGADLVDSSFSNASLRDANLSNAKLRNADFRGADLENADISRADLFKADLHSVNLSGANLTDANLTDTTLRHVYLDKADLIGTNLTDADLTSSYLNYANLTFAYLHETILDNAWLYGANFTLSRLVNVNLHKCKLNRTIFGLTNLSKCKRLETAMVFSECVIDLYTLQKSKDIPRSFLKKIGLSDTHISHISKLIKSTMKNMYPAFLSHSWANKDFAGKLYNTLIEKDVQVWYDEKKMKPGDVIIDSIDKAINVYDKMVLVCSEESLKSWWVEQEMRRIFEKERRYQKEHGKKFRLLIPITIDDAIYDIDMPLARSIREHVIGDFREWEDEDKFEKAVNDLIAALNADRKEDDPGSFLLRND